MNKISRLRVQRFRRLRDLDLEIRPFMVFIGANGVGKSSFLDALSFLSASAAGNLRKTISEFGGITSIETRSKRGEGVSLVLEMEIPNHLPLNYQLSLSPRGTGYSISEEVLSQKRPNFSKPFKHIDSHNDRVRYFEVEQERLVQPDWEHDPLESSLSQVPKMFRQPEELRRLLGSANLYHVLDVGPRAPIKLPQQMKPSTLPGFDGSELVPFLYYLKETEEDRFDTIFDSLRAAFPDLEKLNFPPVAAGMITLTWKDRRYGDPFFMHELSEGTLRFLWLASLLQSPNLSTITMIDEPEVSLHPEMLNLLAGLMREASNRTQLVVATHSDRLIRFLKPSEVVVMDLDDEGYATATWADSLDLDEWLKDFTLDEVWQMGRMGGRS